MKNTLTFTCTTSNIYDKNDFDVFIALPSHILRFLSGQKERLRRIQRAGHHGQQLVPARAQVRHRRWIPAVLPVQLEDAQAEPRPSRFGVVVRRLSLTLTLRSCTYLVLREFL